MVAAGPQVSSLRLLQKPPVLPSPMDPEGTKLGLWSLHQEALLWLKLRYYRLPPGQPRPRPGLATSEPEPCLQLSLLCVPKQWSCPKAAGRVLTWLVKWPLRSLEWGS